MDGWIEGRKEGRKGPSSVQKGDRPGGRNGCVVSQGCEHPVPGGRGHSSGRSGVLGLPKPMRNRPREKGARPAQGSHLPEDVGRRGVESECHRKSSDLSAAADSARL